MIRAGFAGIFLIALLALAACVPDRGIEAALVLGDIGAREQESALKRRTEPPSRNPVRYEIDGRQRQGDLYTPGADPPVAALVLVPGVAPRGKDDPRLVAFATTLARARFLVLVPDIAGLRALRVSAADAVDIADAVRHLAAQTPPADEGSVGLAAISYAAGPALLAAAGPAARQVRFLLAVGGYYDMTALITYVTTGRYRTAPDAPWRTGKPNPYGRWVFLESNAHHVTDERDRVLLRAIAARMRRDPAAAASDLAARLDTEGRAAYALLTNDDPDRVRALIAALPKAMRREVAALDPSRAGLSRLRARLLLLHGRDDPIIPWTESAALAAAAPHADPRLSIVDSLTHVDLEPGGIDDTLGLWCTVYEMLALRDSMPPPTKGDAGHAVRSGL